MRNPDLWVMIPARGDSQGVPRKNVRLLGGRPLITHTITTALEVCPPDRVVVITDDDEIATVAVRESVKVVREPRTTGRATLDEVARKVAVQIQEWGGSRHDVFLTLQPTCPFLQSLRLTEAMAAFEAGAGSVLTVVDDRHLTWRIEGREPVPAYQARVNRQQLAPAFRETGGIIGCRLGDLLDQNTRIISRVHLIEVSKTEAVDIDDFSDWAVAEHLASRRKIVIRADAGPELGMGHVYRGLALAQELAAHAITMVCDPAMPLGRDLLSQYPFPIVDVDGEAGFIEWLGRHQPDLVILDQLDTSAEYVRAVKKCGAKVVSFEDMGLGSLEADLVVSDLYKNLALDDERQLTGVNNALLAPNFETDREPAPFRDTVEDILVMFGGSDPSHLTERTLEALSAAQFDGAVTVVVGPGVKREIRLEPYRLRGDVLQNVRHMPGVMRRMDLAISSAGRTVTELVSLGLPVLCLCQNDKELTHTHAAAQFGVVNLGLGRLVTAETLTAHIDWLVANPKLRRTLRERALHETADRSNAAVISRMMQRLGWAGA